VGDVVLAAYESYGTSRRIEKVTTTDAPGGAKEVHYYYNQDWQLLQSETDAGGPIAVDHYVWSVTYIDAPVGRWHDHNGDGDYLDYTDDGQANDDWVRYFTRDGNQNVTAAVEGTFDSGSQQWRWQLAERYVYTPYGEATAYDADWSNPAAPTADGPLYCGYFFDAETSQYHARHRYYHPTLSTWLTRDLIGYWSLDLNLYRYCEGDPLFYTDPHGLAGKGEAKLIKYMVEKYHLTTEGREALRRALEDLKMGAWQLEKEVVDDEARAIAALGGKYVKGGGKGFKGGGMALGTLMMWLALENTAQAAEISSNWRDYTECEDRGECACARWEGVIYEPPWWDFLDETRYLSFDPVMDPVVMGHFTPADCAAFEQKEHVVKITNMPGGARALHVEAIICSWTDPQTAEYHRRRAAELGLEVEQKPFSSRIIHQEIRI